MTQSGDASTAAAFAEAYAAIRNLYARYNWCSDEGDADGYADCFTEDGELSIPGIGMHVRGRENLREFKRQDKAPQRDRIRRHWNSGLLLEAVGDGGAMRGAVLPPRLRRRPRRSAGAERRRGLRRRDRPPGRGMAVRAAGDHHGPQRLPAARLVRP